MRYRLSIYLPLMLFAALLLLVTYIKPNKVYAYSTDQAAIDAAVNYTHGYNYYVVIKQYSLDKAQFGHVVIYSDSPFAMKRESDSTVWVSATSGGYYYAMSTLGTTYNTSIYGTVSSTTSSLGFYYGEILYSNADIYLKKNLVNSEYYSDQYFYNYSSGGGSDITFISIAQALGLEMEATIDTEWYDQIYRQGYVVIINSDKEKLYSVLSSPEPMVCKKVNRFILSDYYTMSGKIRHRFPRAGEESGDPATYNLVGQTDSEYYATTMKETSEILYTSYDIYDENGVLVKAKNMDVPKWEPTMQYKSDMLRLYDASIKQRENTDDTYILDWLYREITSDLYYTEYEISALSTVEEYQKMTQLRTYLDVLLDGGFSGNMMDKSTYEFDLSVISEKIAIKSWLNESVESVIPDSFYIRPVQMILYDKKVYYGDWLKAVFTYVGNKIVKVTYEDISNVVDNEDGTVTDTVADGSVNYEQTEIGTGKLASEELDEKLNGSSSSAISSATSTLKNIPGLVGALFTFIPTEFIVLLGLALTFIIALMIKRAIL